MPPSVVSKMLTIIYNSDVNKYYSYLCSVKLEKSIYNLFKSSHSIWEKICDVAKKPIKITCDNVTEPLYNKLIVSLKSGLVSTLTCENLEDDGSRVYSLKSSWLNNPIKYQDHCPLRWTTWIADAISYVVNHYIYPNYYSSSTYTDNITSFIEDNILSPLYQNCLNNNLDQDVFIGDSTDIRSIQEKSPDDHVGTTDIRIMGSIIGIVVLGGVVLKTLYNKYSVQESNITNAYSPEVLEDRYPSYSTQEKQLIDYCRNIEVVSKLFQGNIAAGSMPSASTSLSLNSNIEVVNHNIYEAIDTFSFSSSLLGTERLCSEGYRSLLI